MDKADLEILKLIQSNATLPLSELSRRTGLSKTPCWNRIRRLEETGVIKQRATLLDRNLLGLPIIVFLSISVSRHSSEWATRFSGIVSRYAQITEVHRLTGSSADYMLKIVAGSIESYDKFQQILISEIEFTSMSSSVSLQEMKYDVTLPFDQILTD
jgi:DNA-binding Lrp family transcriptional regulator